VKLLARTAVWLEPVHDGDAVADDESGGNGTLETGADGYAAADADAAREAAAGGVSTRLMVEKSCDLVAAGMGCVDSRID